MTGDQSFSKSDRVVLRKDFALIFNRGRVANDDTLVITAIRTNIGHPRLGLAVSKLVGNAPTRNYWKRLIREAFRQQKIHMPWSIDFVVRPKRGSQPDLEKITASLKRLTNKLQKQLPPSVTE